jgi:hypothetical protein
MKRALLILFILITALVIFQPDPAQAQSTPSCSFEADGSIVCSVSGGESEGGQENNGTQNVTETCDPNEVHYGYQLLSHDASNNTCNVMGGFFTCDGIMVEGGETLEDVPCSPASGTSTNPCSQLTVTAGGITCNASGWNLSARVAFPEIFLDLRPYPATLVRWPSAVRNGGLPESSGIGRKDYVANGGGSMNNPQEGDWKDLRLILTLRAAGPMFVTLPHIGDLTLPDQGATGSPTMIKWEVPSHPAAGSGPLAGSVAGLDELPGDMPLFVGNGRAPYKLFWELHYFEYTAKMGCVAGPGDNGKYNCGGGTGHKGIVGYNWKQQSSSGEVPPTAVQNLPAALMADINHDGTPDAYWDNNLTLRRMDDNNRVDNQQYQRSWNWGGIIYWAVREGQGQIGWPGQ